MVDRIPNSLGCLLTQNTVLVVVVIVSQYLLFIVPWEWRRVQLNNAQSRRLLNDGESWSAAAAQSLFSRLEYRTWKSLTKSDTEIDETIFGRLTEIGGYDFWSAYKYRSLSNFGFWW